MDSIKKLTGKNPSEYEIVAKSLVDNSDVELFKRLVNQDDFLFDFIKANVAKRIQHACNKDNYHNLINFMSIYSASYADMIAEVLHYWGKEDIFEEMKKFFISGDNSQKAYAVKYLSLVDENKIKELLPQLRVSAKSEFEPLAINSVELLGKLNDEESKTEALKKLDSEDEFEKYEAVKFLTTFGAKDLTDKIIETMKKSAFSENIAGEIPYLVSLPELLETNFEGGLLTLCNIINSIPDILQPSAVCDYAICEALEIIISKLPDSAAALVLRVAKDKFEELLSNEEYLFDSDKNTKDEIKTIGNILSQISTQKLTSLLYDELYEESDFVLYAIDYADEVEELETLLESKNPTIVLKVLSKLKEKGVLSDTHKTYVFNNISNTDIKNVIEAM